MYLLAFWKPEGVTDALDHFVRQLFKSFGIFTAVDQSLEVHRRRTIHVQKLLLLLDLPTLMKQLISFRFLLLIWIRRDLGRTLEGIRMLQETLELEIRIKRIVKIVRRTPEMFKSKVIVMMKIMMSLFQLRRRNFNLSRILLPRLNSRIQMKMKI